jgi:hypothetical protein
MKIVSLPLIREAKILESSPVVPDSLRITVQQSPNLAK